MARLEIRGPLERSDLAGLAARAARQLRLAADSPEEERLELDLVGVTPNVLAVDVLARIALLARRRSWTVTINDADPELWRLIELSGLLEVFDRR